MAVEIASAYVSIIPTTKGIGANLEKELSGPVEQAAKKAGDSAGRSLDETGKKFTKFGIGALAVAGGIGAGLLATGKSASNLGESVNAVKVTFGSAAEGILKLGEDAATAVGLSNAEFNGLAVQFSSFATTIAGKGGDVVGTMKEMTGRAADFASVMNIDVGEAARIFQSGLAGETEPLKKFGIDLSAAAVNAYAAANGIGAVGKELTESEKVTARYGLLMEQTAKTQGDFANTSDSAANATRIAKAELENASASLGASLTPAIAIAASTVASLAKGFAGLNEATDGWIGKGLGIAALALGAAGGISLLVGQVIKFRNTLATMKAVFVATDGGLTRLGTAAKGAIGPLAILGVAAVGLYLRSQHAADGLRDIANAAAELSTVADEDVFNTLGKSIAAGVVNGLSLDEVTKKLAVSNIEGAKRALEAAEAKGADERITISLRAAIAEQDRATAQLAETNAENATTTDDLTESTDALTLKTGYLAAADALAQAAKEGIAAATEEAQRKSDAFADSLVRQREKSEDLYGKEFDAIQSKHDLADATAQAGLDVAAMNDTLAKHKVGTEEATTATNTAYDSIVKVAEQYGTLNGAALGSDSSIRRQIDSLTVQAQQLAPGSPLRVAIEQYIAELAAIPSSVDTQLRLNISMGQVTTAAGDFIGLRSTGPGDVNYGATGGWREGMTVVGEEGPELVDFRQPGFIYTAQQTKAMMSATESLSVLPGGKAGMNIEHLEVHNDVDADGFFRYANFAMAS